MADLVKPRNICAFFRPLISSSELCPCHPRSYNPRGRIPEGDFRNANKPLLERDDEGSSCPEQSFVQYIDIQGTCATNLWGWSLYGTIDSVPARQPHHDIPDIGAEPNITDEGNFNEHEYSSQKTSWACNLCKALSRSCGSRHEPTNLCMNTRYQKDGGIWQTRDISAVLFKTTQLFHRMGSKSPKFRQSECNFWFRPLNSSFCIYQ
jgi:hypothetical protein